MWSDLTATGLGRRLEDSHDSRSFGTSSAVRSNWSPADNNVAFTVEQPVTRWANLALDDREASRGRGPPRLGFYVTSPDSDFGRLGFEAADLLISTNRSVPQPTLGDPSCRRRGAIAPCALVLTRENLQHCDQTLTTIDSLRSQSMVKSPSLAFQCSSRLGSREGSHFNRSLGCTVWNTSEEKWALR